MIAVQIQDENGVVESRHPDPHIVDVLREHAPADSKCLQFIDAYGDTTFNPYQARALVTEMEVAARSLVGPGQRERAVALVDFVRPVGEMIHMYLKFVGE